MAKRDGRLNQENLFSLTNHSEKNLLFSLTRFQHRYSNQVVLGFFESHTFSKVWSTGVKTS